MNNFIDLLFEILFKQNLLFLIYELCLANKIQGKLIKNKQLFLII